MNKYEICVEAKIIKKTCASVEKKKLNYLA